MVGPTAAGKSALALRLAEERGLAIISADSRQVYTGFDVGTAKPTRDERHRVPHFGIDVVPPTERYSAHRWALDAASWCLEAARANTPPVIVGGTGLYVRALVQPLDAVPMLDAERRAALEPVLGAFSLDELERWCARLDPARAHLGRTQLLRAVETALLAGVRLSDRFAPDRPPIRPVRYLVVDPGPTLADRIAERVRVMIANGFVEEIERLRLEIPPDAPAWNASGYGVMRAAVEGTISLAAATERVIIETRQYAKRQRTWFRHQLPEAHVTRVDPLAADVADTVRAWWDAVAQTSGVHA
ncbi:tRNA (adenosine(37)-N6)-dimethylallyltransferase MiaA [Gemmatimonas sp.]